MTDRSDPDGDRDRREEDLTALVEELSATLDSLRETVREDARGGSSVRRPRRRRTPGPAPPSPRELLRFTEQYTIPTLIALLESGVRSLELLRATLRLVDGRGIEGASPATRERVGAAGRTALDRVDAILSDLGSAVEGGEPGDPAARDLLEDARALREEIDDRLREAEAGGREREGRRRDGAARRTSGSGSTGGRDIPVRPADGSDTAGGRTDEGEGADGTDEAVPVDVDVDAELESIRRDVRGETGTEGTPSDPGDGEEGPDSAGDDDGPQDR